MRKKTYKKEYGFTLIEMLVAVFVFSIIMTIATGAIFSIVSANKTSQALKSVMDNLSSALDSMSRDIRYGTVYHCGGEPFEYRVSCSDNHGDTTFAFLDRYQEHTIIYDFQEESIFKCIDTLANCIRLTAPEVHITNLNFYVQGAEKDKSEQPKVLMSISGYAQAGSARSEFNIETMVTQRRLDLCKDSVPAYLRPAATECL